MVNMFKLIGRFYSKTMNPEFIQNLSVNTNTIPIKNGHLNISTSEMAELVHENSKVTSKIKPLILKTIDPNSVDLAVGQLAQGNVIAVPTDTVYGLACNANNPEAIKKLYNIKGRDNKNPVAICVATISDLKQYGKATYLPDELLEHLLPGAVTVLLMKSINLNNPYLNPGIEKIGIRIPDLDFIRNICAKCLFPIALTSANRSSEKSTLSIDEFKMLWPLLGAVCDGGRIGLTEEQRAASTIVDLSQPNYYKITRSGVAARKTIEILEKYCVQVCD